MKSEPRIFIDNLDMGQALLVGAHFVLAFNDQDAVFFEDAVRLFAGAKIEIEHGGVVARAATFSFAVGIMAAKRTVIAGAGHVITGAAVQALHVRRIEHDAIMRSTGIWQLPAIGPSLDVACVNDIAIFRHLLPEHALAPGHAGDNGAMWNMKG